jgi:hypothetical protein
MRSERFSSEILTVTKKKTKKIERKHLLLRTWNTRLVREGMRFLKTEQMYKIVVVLVINLCFLGGESVCLNNFRMLSKYQTTSIYQNDSCTSKDRNRQAIGKLIRLFLGKAEPVLSFL